MYIENNFPVNQKRLCTFGERDYYKPDHRDYGKRMQESMSKLATIKFTKKKKTWNILNEPIFDLLQTSVDT